MQLSSTTNHLKEQFTRWHTLHNFGCVEETICNGSWKHGGVGIDH
jgi:hypothetical protein